MVGKGSHSRPQNLQANNKQTLNLTKGKPVEVSSDDEGFKGAWYLATILDSPPNVSKKRQKVTVQYKTLIKDDSSPLVESVDLAFIRPLPPDDSNRDFQENDVVDAGYRDGWWAGVVRKVLRGSRYRVYFDNPPDIMDFHARNLRSHLDWVDGNWVSSEKEAFLQTTESIFSSGTEVEVTFAKENPRDAWFPAVVIKENEDGTFQVKCKNSGKIDEAGKKVTVDSHHIRPIPPCYVDRNYELLEKVDVPYSSGWRPGLITKLLAGRRYNVFFKQGNEDKEVNHSQIRPHAEWVDGRWICKSKGVLDVSDNEEQFDSAPNNVVKSKISLESKTPNGMTELKTPCSKSTSVKNILEQSTQRNEKSSSHELPPSKKVKLDTPTSTGSHLQPSKNLTEGSLPLINMPIESPVGTLRDKTNPRTYSKRSRKISIGGNPGAAQTESPHGEKTAVASLADKLIRIKELPENSMHQKSLVAHRQKLDLVTKRGQSTKSPLGSLQVAAKAKSTTHINESEDKMKTVTPLVIALEAAKKKILKDLAGIEGIKQTPGGSSQRRKRGRPRKLKMASGTGKDDSNQEVADKSVVGEKAIVKVDVPIQKVVDCTVSQVASKERETEVSEQDCKTNKIDMAIPDMEDEDRPLSMWIEGMHSSANPEDSQLSSGKPEKRKRDVDQNLIPCVKEVSGTPDENPCLPFVKRSLVWKTIESMEVFQLVPQRPHFQPLADSKEEYREGSAIGVMVTFAALFDKITSLKFDDSKSVLESTLESLVDLEKHGFDVYIPRERVNQLFSIKDGVEKLQCESKDTENQIKEISDERKILDENAKDIEKKIAELEKELAAAKSKLESKDSEIAKLQTVVDSVNVQMNENRSEFEKVASAPWKLL